jgi:hypothetical protein
VEGEVFAMQTLYHNLRLGKKGIYIASTTDPKTLREYFKEFGWDVEEFEDNFAIVDAYSAMVGLESEERYFVKDPEDINDLDEVLAKAIEEFPAGVVTFGSLGMIADLVGEEEVLEYIKKWNKHLMLYDGVGIYNFTAWPYPEEILRKLKGGLFNATVKVSGVGKRIIFGQYYAIARADWVEPQQKAVLFRIYRPGGVKAFIPKVLVTGPFNAGKSTFVHALSTRAVSVDRAETTIALDHGHVDHKGFAADIFGTPGQERFSPILKLLGGEALGVFLLVDSTKPEEFARAKQMLEETRTFGLPYVVVANKQDLAEALSPEEIRKRMKVPEKVPIIPAVATEKKGVFEAFETLIDMIVEVI